MRKEDIAMWNFLAKLKSCNTRTSQKVTHPTFTIDETDSTTTKNTNIINSITISSMSIYSNTRNRNIFTTSYITRARLYKIM